jgi:anti-sigma factor RsiW
MRIADGCKPRLSPGEIETHIADCASCRDELAQMKAVMGLLDSQKRRELPANIWSAVERRLERGAPQKTTRATWQVFIALALLLAGYKFIELAAERDFGLAFKVVPLLIAVAVFLAIKENPFKINVELKLEGE